MSLPERMLWARLKVRRPGEPTFRRQQPFGPYVLDFYCAKSRLAVEIDGWSHGVGDQPDFDLERDLWFAGQGVETLRVPAHVVLSTPDEAAYNVWLAAAARAPTTAVPAVPLPRFAGEDQQG